MGAAGSRQEPSSSIWASKPTSGSTKKAHPGLRVTRIEAYAARLEEHGAKVVWDDNLPGHRRFYSEDPVGNRLEFLEPTGTGAL